ncbi:Uma2 family endonuclease [Roseisolibacter sp. H3M3-2]|uniref:Uma2 family endonuclease n=1 Tax=Roseisolibacter sp. H3M3-2 TaxID=3031323 RepID=UPI0023DC623A|nr:Uma2 family endonuclease [Roseisolibacter sp. H3M3-2]MDF1504467.1 Uma2 family endonuclease [Roseisolibacter sp. H3M3-2]
MEMPNVEPTYHTADMVRALIDEERAWPRYETIWGELHVTPAPRPWHQLVVGRLQHALVTYLERERVGVLLGAPADISWGRDDVLVQPDIFVMPVEMARAAVEADTWMPVCHLLLAVEVLSPGSVRADRFTKRTLYQKMNVPLYWAIEPDAHVVEVWTPDAHFPTVERETLTWHPAPDAPAFVLRLAELFRPI